MTVRLWGGPAPGARGETDDDIPTVIVHLPAKPEVEEAAASDPGARRTMVLVCPGGGYGGLAMGHEGIDIARWWNDQGVAAAILNYRHRGKGYGHPAPIQDAQRAMRMIRARADEWRVDSGRVGVMGFSAGGHLASTLGTHFDAGDPEHTDPIERFACRPDFLILCYPVIALGEPHTHRGSQTNLLGENADEELIRSLSNEKQVTSRCPPTFLFHTDEDQAVNAENSVAFYLALHRAGVPAELHVFRRGRHGVGLASSIPATDAWPELCLQWLRTSGFLTGRTER